MSARFDSMAIILCLPIIDYALLPTISRLAFSKFAREIGTNTRPCTCWEEEPARRTVKLFTPLLSRLIVLDQYLYSLDRPDETNG